MTPVHSSIFTVCVCVLFLHFARVSVISIKLVFIESNGMCILAVCAYIAMRVRALVHPMFWSFFFMFLLLMLIHRGYAGLCILDALYIVHTVRLPRAHMCVCVFYVRALKSTFWYIIWNFCTLFSLVYFIFLLENIIIQHKGNKAKWEIVCVYMCVCAVCHNGLKSF